jgi:hypothetical protein
LYGLSTHRCPLLVFPKGPWFKEADDIGKAVKQVTEKPKLADALLAWVINIWQLHALAK